MTYYNMPDGYRDDDYDVDQYMLVEESRAEIQNLKDCLKEEMMELKRAIEAGDIREIDDCIEEIYGYLED